MKTQLRQSILAAARKSKLIQSTARFIVDQTANSSQGRYTSYPYQKNKFINNGENHRFDKSVRSEIISRFEQIDRNVPIGSTPTDAIFMAEMLLNMEGEGAIVECGCYAGGSTSKLSIIAKLLDRELVVFDSFEGLPVVEDYYLRDKHCRRGEEWVTDWSAGRYAARLDEVKGNVAQYGELSKCSFVKGWFSESLTAENLPMSIAFAFVDVDLANSARDCFVAIWPALAEKGIFVTHDTSYIKVLQEFYNPELWRKLNSIPPILFGAGYGLSNESPHIGYMVKGDSLSPDYLKDLTLEK
jgi:O-methyltransferase